MKAVRMLRNERGESQTAFARRVGMDRTALSKIEHGHHSPTAPTLKRLADGFEMSVAAFLSLEERITNPKVPAPMLPEVRNWVRELGPEAALLAMDDDEFHDDMGSLIRSPFDVRDQITRVEAGRDAIEAALKGPARGMPEVLCPESDKDTPIEERLHANHRRRRGEVGRWARSRALVRSLNLMESARQFISDEVEGIEAPEAETAEKKA